MTDKPSITQAPIEQQIPAHHPLRLLHALTAEPVQYTMTRLSTAGTPEPEMPLDQALRAALLQAFYWLPDHQHFADHLRFNALFRWFIGLDDLDQTWDSALYAQLQQRLTNDQELRQFFDLVAATARAKKQAESTQIANALDRWISVYSPRSVYFHHYSKSPLKEVMLTIEAFEPDSRQPVFPAHIMHNHLKSTFPVKEVDSEYGYGEVPELRTSDGLCRVMADGRGIVLWTSAHYETWEETFRPYAVDVVNACKATYNQAKITKVAVLFSNLITLPAEVELTEYFHMLPNEPPRVIPPRFMREQNLSYSFPKRLIRANHSTDLMYDDDPRFLRCIYTIEPVGPSLEVRLDLESHWIQECTLDQVLELADGLKKNVYIAFHSLITDQTRALFE
jgi:uncharacterized protein (TIGR04255 family)